ncbi:MAG: hypothetical protein WBL63_07060 [Candidatus Acidiferrum sp.]
MKTKKAHNSQAAAMAMCFRHPDCPGVFLSLVLASLLCVIVLAEFPELITLTDDTTNDFTISVASSTAPHGQHGQRAVCAVTAELTAPRRPMHAAILTTIYGFNPNASDLLILHSVLRT